MKMGYEHLPGLSAEGAHPRQGGGSSSGARLTLEDLMQAIVSNGQEKKGRHRDSKVTFTRSREVTTTAAQALTQTNELTENVKK